MNTRHGILKFFEIRRGSSGYQGSNMSFGKGYGGSYYTGYVYRRHSHQYGRYNDSGYGGDSSGYDGGSYDDGGGSYGDGGGSYGDD